MHQQFIILQRCAEDLSLRCMQCHHEVHGDGLAGVAEKFAVAPAAAPAAAVYNSSEQRTPSGPSLRSAMRPTRAIREHPASILARTRGRLRPMAISETAAASTAVASRAFLSNPIHVRVVATHARSLALRAQLEAVLVPKDATATGQSGGAGRTLSCARSSSGRSSSASGAQVEGGFDLHGSMRQRFRSQGS